MMIVAPRRDALTLAMVTLIKSMSYSELWLLLLQIAQELTFQDST